MLMTTYDTCQKRGVDKTPWLIPGEGDLVCPREVRESFAEMSWDSQDEEDSA